MVEGGWVGWGYEILCVLSREVDVGACVLRLVYGGGGLGWMGVSVLVCVE